MPLMAVSSKLTTWWGRAPWMTSSNRLSPEYLMLASSLGTPIAPAPGQICQLPVAS